MADDRPHGATCDVLYEFSRVFVRDRDAMGRFDEDVFGLLEAVAGLDAEEARRALAVDEPEITRVLAHPARGRVTEARVDAIASEVRELDDVGVAPDPVATSSRRVLRLMPRPAILSWSDRLRGPVVTSGGAARAPDRVPPSSRAGRSDGDRPGGSGLVAGETDSSGEERWP